MLYPLSHGDAADRIPPGAPGAPEDESIGTGHRAVTGTLARCDLFGMPSTSHWHRLARKNRGK